ncbi:hypothetical protein [Segniliparus rugosus]|uniref:PknH-like extracellular domain-containing protein n=1 Tax=Segniliparus rugosus (strain ATCC BAA-974 / DSM 45345 / CCUG 50838 / CIP 108380 / JCM 13579 / CDC 945) TaxID=679197 RepID=E5XRJ7_SEGRC|nr:hypothetical protein [Segniliparus rugosus]EFV13015.1 hypothetical protein HMPREF9336_02119 [Segniliparus rugosus ATCC BAA-974]
MRHRLTRRLAVFGFAAAMLLAGAKAHAEPNDLPASADLGQFYPKQADLPDGWSLTSQEALAAPSPDSTTPAGCSLAHFFPPGSARTVAGPGNSTLVVRLLVGRDGLHTVRSWAEKCASFTMLGGGGTTGKNWMSVQTADAPASGALAYRVTGQGPYAPAELLLAGSVRGALVLVAQLDPADDAAADVYRAVAAKINDWRG